MSFNKEQQAIVDHVKPLLDLIQVCNNLEKQLLDQPTNLGFMSDTTFMSRKCTDILDALKKRLDELETKIAMQAATVLTVSKIDKYQGDYCTISDNSTPYVRYPQSPSDPGYQEFIAKLAPEDVRPHYPTVSAKLATELENGNQLPFGLDGEKIISFNFKLRMTSRSQL